MRKMRQRVEVGLPRRQNTPVAQGESSTLSDMNVIPVAFNQNQISALVLPLVSDSKKLLWVQADEVSLQLDVAAQLDKTFDVFPYPTQKLTAALAKRCSLHPDQVRVWFMLQRLRHGVSWDSADIPKVQKKIKLSQVRRKTGRKKARKARVVENLSDNELLEREIKEEQLTQEERGRKVQSGERKTQKKWKRMTVAGRLSKKRAEEVDIRGDKITMASAESKPWRSARKRKRKDCAVLKCAVAPSNDVNRDVEMKTQVEGEPHASSRSPIDAVTEFCQLKEVIDVTNGHGRQRRKTNSQLVLMKRAFLSCQYPDGEDYDHLSKLSGVSRDMLVQWFSDMRYYVKKKRPHWMNEAQHRQALANIQYRQCLSALTRKVSDLGDNAAWV